MKKPIRVCIIIPAYNEQEVIYSLLKQLPKKQSYSKNQATFMAVVVDDGSSDKTVTQAKKVAGTIILSHPINMGAGAATRTGLHYARRHGYDLAVSMDADGQHATSDLHVLINKMIKRPEIDILVGSRLQSRGNMPLHKLIGNHLLSGFTFLVMGAYVADSQSGFRVFSGRALENLEYHSNGYSFCSEMLWQARRLKLNIREEQVKAIYTQYSLRKGQKSFSGGLQILQQLIFRKLIGN